MGYYHHPITPPPHQQAHCPNTPWLLFQGTVLAMSVNTAPPHSKRHLASYLIMPTPRIATCPARSLALIARRREEEETTDVRNKRKRRRRCNR